MYKRSSCRARHEDVLFFSESWGKNVLAHFDNHEVGMIGVSGGMAQSIVPGAWWYNNYFGKCAINILMSQNGQPGKDHELLHNNPFPDNIKAEVVIIDGLWFCIKKKV